ncbi:MAG: UDP-N-acetylglucosamine 4,6-dehydratase (inverting) [Pseudomonadota bacterium]
MSLEGKVVLVTGGTGSFGRKFADVVLREYRPKKLIIFSRDEFKQDEMMNSGYTHPSIRYFIGDVRDKSRLYRALDGVDVVVHAAALKQVPACEYNPLEAVKTNVIGTANLVEAAVDRDVQRVLAISTDKALVPVSLYGATKLCADKLFIAANSYAGSHGSRFSVTRYGNVLGSRGSVVPLFRKLAPGGVLPITDLRMTRFWLTLEQGVRFVLKCLGEMEGGEIFVPKIPSLRITDLAESIAPGCKMNVVGLRPGEKLHEVLVSEEDARHTVEYEDHYVTLAPFRPESAEARKKSKGGRPCPEGFRYASDTNDRWISREELKGILDRYNTENNVTMPRS